jgi:serine/threonine-protein kinase
VLYECVTGRLVFDPPNLSELGVYHLNRRPPDPSVLNRDVPAEFSRIILRALAHRPADRWQTAADLLKALETV